MRLVMRLVLEVTKPQVQGAENVSASYAVLDEATGE